MKGSSYPKVNVGRWRVHVEAALASGQSLAGYAREHGLSAHTLYAARGLMRQQELRPKRKEAAAGAPMKRGGAFVPVSVQPGLMMTAQLPNGVQLQWELGEASLPVVLAQLAGLQCWA